MIEKLKKKDLKEAAKVYNKGLQMEIPKGYRNLNKLIKILDKEVRCFVHKTNNKMDGLVSFCYKTKNKIQIGFICALKPRKRIGSKLIKKLADLSLKNNVQFIYSNVSSKDKRVMNFYEFCGFKKYGKYYARKDFMLYRIKAKPERIKESLKRRTPNWN